MHRGDVVRVDIPRPAAMAGREQFGYRPAIVIQDTPSLAKASTAIVIPLTSNLAAKKLPGSFTVEPTDSNGLQCQSVVLTSQIRAIDPRRIERTIGKISVADMTILERHLRSLLRLP
jgi:mRNA-degrading endonuclease toxin of MazEF toxin-antitoxin module